jgi:hypothetical protein
MGEIGNVGNGSFAGAAREDRNGNRHLISQSLFAREKSITQGDSAWK